MIYLGISIVLYAHISFEDASHILLFKKKMLTIIKFAVPAV